MARKFLTNIDLNTNELQNAVVQNLSSAPTSGNKEGRIYYDSVTQKLRYYGNSAWHDLAAGGAAASTVTLTGDVTGTANVDPDNGIITVNTTADSKFVTLTGSQTLENKTLSNPSISGTIEASSSQLNIVKTEYYYNGTQEGVIAAMPAGDLRVISTNGDLTLESHSGTIQIQASVIDATSGNAEMHLKKNEYWYNGSQEGIVAALSSGEFDITAVNSLRLEANNGQVELYSSSSNDINLHPGSGTTRAHGSFVASYDLRVGAQDSSDGYFYVQKSDGTVVFKVDSGSSNASLNGVLDGYNGNTRYIEISASGSQNDAKITAWNNDLILSADGNIRSLQSLHAEGGIVTGDVVNDSDLTIQSYSASVDITGNTGVNITAPTTTVTGNAHVTGNLQVDGDLNVTGKLNAINKTEIDIQDNTIRLNTGYTGAPVADAGIIVTRGTANDTAIIWSESNTDWTLSNDGSHYFAIARKFASAIGDGSATSYDVVHNLGTRDVTVQVYQNSSAYDVVETDIQMKDNNTVTISFTSAPSLNAYKVVIVG